MNSADVGTARTLALCLLKEHQSILDSFSKPNERFTMNRKITIGLVGLSVVATPVWMATSQAGLAEQASLMQEKNPVFHGKVETVDTSANTLTVDGKVINITASSKLTKADKAITLADIKVGDSVHGTTRQTVEGRVEALTVRVGPAEARPKN
jgi:ribosomal protein S1